MRFIHVDDHELIKNNLQQNLEEDKVMMTIHGGDDDDNDDMILVIVKIIIQWRRVDYQWKIINHGYSSSLIRIIFF